MSKSEQPLVYLVGAGPGDPSLMTVRAAQLLSQADTVLYDQLVPRRMLAGARADAELVCVRDLPGKHPDKYPYIFELMIERARAGKMVVRLKGGDPLIFGRGGEEAEALREAGLAYEIVPGVTAALAAAAYLEIPLTHRRQASALALVTGHEMPLKASNKLDWSVLAKFPGTLAIYMGIARLPLLVAELLKQGKNPSTPAAIVERAGTGEMRTTYAPLAELDAARRAAGLEAPGLILVGDVLNLRNATSWFEKKPLFGRRVLVTRPKKQAEPLLQKLERLGAVTFSLPVVDIVPPRDWASADHAIEALQKHAFDWLIFTSANGVKGFMDRLHLKQLDARVLGGVKLATIGDATARSLWQDYRLRADVAPDHPVRSEEFLQALAPHVVGQRVLLIRGEPARDYLLERLPLIASQVRMATVYEQQETLDPEHESMASLRRGEIQYVLLTSNNIARVLVGSFDSTIRGRVEREEIKLIVMSEDVAQVIQNTGLPVGSIAAKPSVESLVEELVQLAKNENRAAY